MTMTDAIGRIAQIQATLVQLDSRADGVGRRRPLRPTSATSATSATDFASALSGALGATDGSTRPAR